MEVENMSGSECSGGTVRKKIFFTIIKLNLTDNEIVHALQNKKVILGINIKF
jgi:hypothetical protein